MAARGHGKAAKVAELVDALALGASGGTRESSSLSFRTINLTVYITMTCDLLSRGRPTQFKHVKR